MRSKEYATASGRSDERQIKGWLRTIIGPRIGHGGSFLPYLPDAVVIEYDLL
jgi:hypothetical protein